MSDPEAGPLRNSIMVWDFLFASQHERSVHIA